MRERQLMNCFQVRKEYLPMWEKKQVLGKYMELKSRSFFCYFSPSFVHVCIYTNDACIKHAIYVMNRNINQKIYIIYYINI